MSRWIGLILVGLMLGMSFSAAVTQSFVSAESDSSYQEFWSILNKEAELIVKLNSTKNATLAQELIQNSRLGALNAVNISAQIWQALEELKASGVKTYYSAEELRRMAENISKNGLPEETVQALKSQGWSDEEIKALQEYITKNADNITTGFNMTAFLENFSTAFIKVAFKYNNYETWGWKKLLNANTTSLNLPILTTWEEKSSVPFIWQKFKEFNKTFQNASLQEKISLIENLKKQIINFSKENKEKIISTTSKVTYANNTSGYERCFVNPPNNQEGGDDVIGNKYIRPPIKNSSPINLLKNLSNSTRLAVGFESVTKSRRVLVQGDYVIIMIVTKSYHEKLIPIDCSVHVSASTSYELYYWNVFKALEKLSDLEVLLKAEELGDNNPHLNKLVQNITSQLGEYFKTSLRGEYLENFHLRGVYTTPKPLANPQKRKVTSSAPLNALSNEQGYLSIGVSVVKEEVTKNYATYRVEASLKAEDNTVSDVSVKVSGSGLSDSKHYEVIHPADGVITWYSKPSGEIHGSDVVTVSGTVTVTYTPSDHDLPTSITPPEEGLNSNSQSRTVTISYSGTIRLGNTIDKSKVQFQILPSSSSVKPGENVTFYVRVHNGNNAMINGSYELNIAVPGSSEPITKRGHVSLNPNSNSGLIPVTTITYTETGTYGYSGTFDFDGYEKHDDGDITVKDNNDNVGSLIIESVSISPQEPRDGSAVNFTVKVKSTYSTSQDVKLKLFVNGNLVNVTQGSINSNSEGTFNLHWLAEKGEHSYTIKAYSIIGGQEFMDDEESGSISVASPSQQFAVKLEAFPRELVGGGTVYFTVKVFNYVNSAYSIRGYVVGEDGSKVYPKDEEYFEARLPANGNYTTYFDLPVSGIGNHTYMLYVDNYGGESHTDSVKIEVEPPTVQTAVMNCGDLLLSAEKGNFVLDLSCEVYFTNPTDVEWHITDVTTEARILKNQYTKEVTPEFTDTLLTPTIPPKGTGKLKIDFHDVLSASGILEKGAEIADLAGISVPVQVDFTLEVNGKTYVIDSQGNTWSLKYTAYEYTKIVIEMGSVVQNIIADTAAGIVIGATAGAIVGSLLPGVGTAGGAMAGGVIGGTLGFLYGVIWHGILGRP